MWAQRGVNIVFGDAAQSSASELPAEHMKLQTRSWDGASRHAAYAATRTEVGDSGETSRESLRNRFGTARQRMALERCTNPKPLGVIVDRAAF